MDGNLIPEIISLNKNSQWDLESSELVDFFTYHPQGMTKVDDDTLFLSSVEIIVPTQRFDNPTGRYDRTPGLGEGHLFKLDTDGNLIDSITLSEGNMYHPGGIDYDGEYVWISVAEYRPDSESVIYRVEPDTMEPTEVFRFEDHIGGVFRNPETNTLYGVSWGSRRLYTWELDENLDVINDGEEPEFVLNANSSYYIDYQDAQYVDENLGLFGGIQSYQDSPNNQRQELGGLELVDLTTDKPVFQVPIPLWTEDESKLVMTHNPFYVETSETGLKAYFLPEDDSSRLYIYNTDPELIDPSLIPLEGSTVEIDNQNTELVQRFVELEKGSDWELISDEVVDFFTYHPQGMTKVDDTLFLSSVEIIVPTEKFDEPQNGYDHEVALRDRTPGEGEGHLFKLDTDGNLIDSITLSEGDMYHPGGIDYDGEYIWMPVAEYRPNSESVIYRINPDTLEATEVFRFEDHIGGVFRNRDTNTLHGVSWGSRRLYTWQLDENLNVIENGGEVEFSMNLNSYHYIDYQDAQYVGDDLGLFGGIQNYRDSEDNRSQELGGLELVDLSKDKPVHQVSLPLWTEVEGDEKPLVMTHNPFYLETTETGLKAYFLPEDDTSRLFIYELQTEFTPEPKTESVPYAHAHNDYEHEVPLFDALSNGFISVEADIWLYPNDNNNLRVAHDPVLDPTTLPTLEESYLDPLQELQEQYNNGGIYADGTPIILLVDLKSEGLSTYQRLDEVLSQYQTESPGLFTIYTKDDQGNYEVTPGAVTPIISGDRPREYMESQEIRYAGYDGRKSDIGTDADAGFMPLISDNWNRFFRDDLAWDGTGTIPEDTQAELERIVNEVQGEGKIFRFWNLPQDSANVWKPLYEAEIDLINTDNLAGLSEYIQFRESLPVEPKSESVPYTHAHNDYEHDNPLFDALSYGFISVEADIWFYEDDNGNLRVAHDPVSDPTTLPTLEESYLDPLKHFKEQFDNGGIYADGTPITLLVDIKSEGLITYQRLHDVLSQYQAESPGLFTTYTKDDQGNYEVTPGAVTPIISGDRPREYMDSQEIRYAGYDGRKSDIGTGVDAGFMPLISDNWNNFFSGDLAWDGTGIIPEDTKAELERIVNEVQGEGKTFRFWNLPQDKPSVWRQLLDVKIDYINTDNLGGLSTFVQAQINTPTNPTTLVGWASLPSDTIAPGPESGANVPGGPYDGQPIGGLSGVQFADHDSYYYIVDTLVDDSLLRIYQLKPDFSTAEGGTGEVLTESFINLSDPNNLVPFEITNENTTDRLLTAQDFDTESLVVGADGSFWVGDEYGPFLLHFSAKGVLLEEPILTPNIREFNTLNGQDPFVIGHQGASGELPPHTLEAYELAIQQGADFIEPDLIITKDGYLIARHDPNLIYSTDVAEHPEFADRFTTKIVGDDKGGQPQEGYFVEDFTLEEIKTLRAIQNHDFRDQSYNGLFEIPTLEEIIDLVQEVEANTGKKIGIYPETKHPAYFRDEAGLDMEQALVDTLLAKGFTNPEQLFIQSFQVESLVRLDQTLLPGTLLEDTPMVQLYGDLDKQPYDITNNFNDPNFDPMSVYGSDLITASTTYGDLINQDNDPNKNLLKDYVATYAEGIGPNEDWVFKTRQLDEPVDGDGDGVAEITQQLTGEILPVIEDAHEAGLETHIWTFRDEERYLLLDENGNVESAEDAIKRAFYAGADAIFTDFPATGSEVRDQLTQEYVATANNPLVDYSNLPNSRGFESLAYSRDRRYIYPMLEATVEGDPEGSIPIYQYDTVNKTYADTLVGYYQLEDSGITPPFQTGDFTPINDHEFLVIERDDFQAEEAFFKKVFKIDINQKDADGFVKKEALIDLLDVKDPNDLNNDGNSLYTMPITSIEDLLIVDESSVLVAVDNNFPYEDFGAGRPPELDNNEMILVGLSEPLDLDPAFGQPDVPAPSIPKVVTGTPNDDEFDSAFPDNKQFVGEEQILFTGGGDDYVDVSEVGRRNRINTGTGDDIVFAGTRNRIILGAGDDILFAGAGRGANRISLGAGEDQLWLTEDDNAIPRNPNRVSDFNPNEDMIGFANTVLSLGNKGNLWDYEQVNNDVIISAFGQEIAQLFNTTVTDANFVFA